MYIFVKFTLTKRKIREKNIDENVHISENLGNLGKNIEYFKLLQFNVLDRIFAYWKMCEGKSRTEM